MFPPAATSGLARLVTFLSLVAASGLAACGGTDSASVNGTSGSAVALSGTFKSKPFTARDAASVVIPASGSLSSSLLAIIYSDTTGICQQANTTFDPNTTFFLAVLEDGTNSAKPPAGTYTIIDTSAGSASLAPGDSGIAEVFGSYQNESVAANGGTFVITLEGSDTFGGTSSGSVSATLNGTTILTGKFEAPECAPLGALVSSALGLSSN